MAKDLTEALHELTEQARGQTSRANASLPAGKPVSAIPERSGSSVPSGGSGQGIASPLTEVDYAVREWYTEAALTSTDGIFTIKLKPIKKITMTDALSNVVVLNFKGPP
jgi:hypothetical protein